MPGHCGGGKSLGYGLTLIWALEFLRWKRTAHRLIWSQLSLGLGLLAIYLIWQLHNHTNEL